MTKQDKLEKQVNTLTEEAAAVQAQEQADRFEEPCTVGLLYHDRARYSVALRFRSPRSVALEDGSHWVALRTFRPAAVQ